MSNFLNTDLIAPCNAQCSFCFLNYTEVLGNNNLFKDISSDEIGYIIRTIHHQVKSYRKGDIVAQSGDEYNNLFIIVEGSVVGEIVDFEGKILRIEELRAPDTIASAFIFGKNNRLPVDIIAIENTRLLAIPRYDLLQLLKSNERILHNYLDIMANRAQHLSVRIRMLGMQNIKSKLAHYLLDEVKGSQSNELRLRHSQTELSEIFGVTRPSVTRVIRAMHRNGIINAHGRTIRILDSKALSQFL